MEKRYQVFVSSTFQDLQEERQEVMHALLELDCIPSGMELFPAADESQWSLIKRVIEDCDYYILILGGRYGTIGPGGMGYTEMEYRHALLLDKPVMAFLHKEPGKILAEKTEKNPEGIEKLKSFRELVQTKMCKHWESSKDLGSVVSRSLVQLIKYSPAIGWVRADELPDKDATMELLSLRRKVDELEREVAKSRISAPKGTEHLAQGDELQVIHFSYTEYDYLKFDKGDFHASFKASWKTIFARLAPVMIDEASEATLRTACDDYCGEVAAQRKLSPGALGVKNYSMAEDDYQTIKVQLRALGLIAKSERQRSLKQIGTYWTLTPYGDETMTRLRAIQKTNGSPK